MGKVTSVVLISKNTQIESITENKKSQTFLGKCWIEICDSLLLSCTMLLKEQEKINHHFDKIQQRMKGF